MTTPSGPFTVRKWKDGKPGAIIEQAGKTIMQTTSDTETEKLIAGLQATIAAPVAPKNLTPPVIGVKS